jgi:hypothetical protein
MYYCRQSKLKVVSKLHRQGTVPGNGSPPVNKHKGTDQMIRSLWFCSFLDLTYGTTTLKKHKGTDQMIRSL